ncbi:ubiquitin carboxyl-terminal hydrolase 12 [Phtheirospermum japonicum]|uniref:Ubiquitin carboxyl-terminal hydrolase 12 n=1 Tax=Phtheirospermum japonicum TaxID=374723 RepID=A0A830C3L5_9LAMI|nr:ubiquitin carboxyl-terminal hydrolase 12 [Phtheirospermum japonicum]
METREASPAHLLVKIESFSLLHKCGIEKYETRDFDAGNYKWRLIIHPKGHGPEKDGEYISVYLAISDTNSLPENWEVNAVFSIFILNQISGNYHYTPGKTTRRYFSMMTDWGFPKFISKKLFTNPSNGYLMDDNCVFGAEVFVNKNKVVTECLSLKNVTVPYKKVSPVINTTPGGERVKASFTICIKNQLASAKHQKKTTLPVMVETVSRKIHEHITEQCLVCYDVGIPCSARKDCNDPLSLIFPFQGRSKNVDLVKMLINTDNGTPLPQVDTSLRLPLKSLDKSSQVFQGGNVGHLHKLLSIESSSQVYATFIESSLVGVGCFEKAIANNFSYRGMSVTMLKTRYIICSAVHIDEEHRALSGCRILCWI